MRRRRRAYLLLAAIGLFVAPAVVWRLQLKSAVRGEYASLRALGVPTTDEAYAKWVLQFPELPKIDAFEKAQSTCTPIPFDVIDSVPSFYARHEDQALRAVPYGEVARNAMKRFISENGETLQLLHEGRAFEGEGCVGGTGRRRLRGDIIKLCCVQACVKADEGDGAAATDAILDGLAYLKASVAEPWNPTILLGVDGVEQLMSALTSAAARTVLPESGLDAIQSALEIPDWLEVARQAAIEDAGHTATRLYADQLNAPQARIADMVFGFMDRYYIEELQSQRLRISLLGKSLKEQQADFAVMKREGRRRYLRVVGPPLEFTVAVAGIEVIRAYQNTGTLPDRIERLDREGLNLADFYADGPLTYRVDSGTFKIYSVGPDLHDDGGDARKDIVFTVPRLGSALPSQG